MTLDKLLASMGLNIASSAVYELVTRYARSNSSPTVEGLRDTLASSLAVPNAQVAADRIIEFLAKTGSITISGSRIFAADQVTMGSLPGTRVSFGDGSVSRTDSTSIEATVGARSRMQGGAKVVQNPDGSISFWA